MKRHANSLRGLEQAWLVLVLLAMASLLLTHRTGGLSGSAFTVAALVWIKAQIVARRFLELGHAGRVFQLLIQVFMAFGPLGLIMVGGGPHHAV